MENVFYCFGIVAFAMIIAYVVSKMGSYQKDVREHFNKDNTIYNDNLGKISQDINGIFELLNKQPEKKDDDSAFWGVLSGILSGALSSFLMKNVSKDSEKTEPSKERFVVRKKGEEEFMDKEFNSMDEVYKWYAKNGLNYADYEIGKIEPKPEETQE